VGSWPLIQTQLSKPAKALCEKWGIIFPIDPDMTVTDDDCDLVLPPVSYLSPPSTWGEIRKIGFEGFENKPITHIDGKLTLMIDTNYDITKILDAVKIAIKLHPKKKQKTHAKKHNIDKWELYDLKKKGFNLLEITRKIFDIENSPNNLPSYNPRVDSNYKQVKRAYNKACNILKMIEKEAS